MAKMRIDQSDRPTVKAECLRLLVTLKLNRKLGNLPEDLADSVKSLEQKQLDSLTEDLLDFQSIDDLQNWLSSL
jgi:hypothetical protein